MPGLALLTPDNLKKSNINYGEHDVSIINFNCASASLLNAQSANNTLDTKNEQITVMSIARY